MQVYVAAEEDAADGADRETPVPCSHLKRILDR